MVEIVPSVLAIDYFGFKVDVDTVKLDTDVIYKVNLSHPLFIRKVVTETGSVCWQEEGGGETEQSIMLGKLIERSLCRQENIS